MDIWGMLFAGRALTEDDGSATTTIWAGDEFKVTASLKTPDPRDPQFREHWASLSKEVERMVTRQLTKMRDAIINRAITDDKWREHEF